MTGVCSLTCVFSVQVIHVVISVISVHCSLYVRTILHFIYIYYINIFVYSLTVDGHLDCFQLLAPVSSASLNVGVQGFV